MYAAWISRTAVGLMLEVDQSMLFGNDVIVDNGSGLV